MWAGPWRDHYRCSSPVPPPTWAMSCTRFSTRIQHIRRRLPAVVLRSERSGSSSCNAQFFRFDPASWLSAIGGHRSRTCASRARASAPGSLGRCPRCRLRDRRRCTCTRRFRGAIGIIRPRPAACCRSSSQTSSFVFPCQPQCLGTPVPRAGRPSTHRAVRSQGHESLGFGRRMFPSFVRRNSSS